MSERKSKPKNMFSTERQPKKRRGKSQQTRILEAIRNTALLECSEDMTLDEVEIKFFEYLANVAFKPTEENAQQSSVCLQTLAKKGWPDVKATMPMFDFDLDTSLKPHKQAEQVLNAVAGGLLPADIGQGIIAGIQSTMKIKEVDDLEERLKALEDSLGING